METTRIEDTKDYQNIMTEIDALMDKDIEPTSEEGIRLQQLSILVEAYETGYGDAFQKYVKKKK